MPDYNLSGLSTRSFEQLIQALSVKILGPGTIIFGDGPDGGREATFEGKLLYPNVANPWNGYLVVQAKFKQRLEGTTKDGEWAVGQLRGELEKFASRKQGLRKPEFYLFCTNVVLTPKYRTGSKDRIARVFADFRKRLPLVGYDVWDHDKLRVFLDGNSDIRRAYSAWITPGDVLASIVSHLEKFKPNFEKNISAFLQKELLADQYVNLDQAGHSTEEQVPMARVFVDLIATPQPVSDTLQDETEAKLQSPTGFVREVLNAGARRLNNEDTGGPRESTVQAKGPGQPDFGRFVLIGGPGQGKSTTAQYLCQVYRVALLADRHKALSPECRSCLSLIQKQCKAEWLPAPGARRFPIRVVLSDFAKELASDKPEAPRSLLGYIAHKIRHRTNSDLSMDDIKEWLAGYPWFLVLDGLDEVPASSNRGQVLSAISDFWVDVASNRGDLLVLATTRPQGYSHDFSPDFYTHRYLTPLSVKHALRYAERLTEARFGHDVERARRVLERLTNASTVSATARLMTSPLQVTIMATLVDRAGQPPPERWRLFSEYYDVIYKREMERDNPAARILRSHKTNIDGIHQLAGLELQTEGERTGRTDARLSREDFAAIVKFRLGSEGYTGIELDNLCNNITDAATQRLVFLVGMESDQIGFEIRSLQEFMAAEALMEGTDGEIDERLKAIAPITYWRNVFLFAAGKCFTHRLHLRDVVASVCENLNEESDLDHQALTGSEVALDLVRDGTARQHPKFQNRIVRLACRLLDRPCGGVHQLLADSHYEGVDLVFREEVRKGFPVGSESDQSGGVLTAAWLTIKGVSWASGLADSNWPVDSRFQSVVLKRLLSAARHPWLEEKIVAYISQTSEVPRSLSGLRKLAPAAWDKALGLVFGEVEGSKAIAFQPPTTNSRKFFFQIIPCGDSKTGQSLLDLPAEHGFWESIRDCARFMVNPTSGELASWLIGLAGNGDWQSAQNVRWPWPLRACLKLAKSQDSLGELAKQASEGRFGDQDDWLAAEARWARGITTEDFIAFDRHDGIIGPSLRDVGFPIETLGTSAVPDAELESVLSAFLRVLPDLRFPPARSTVASSALFVASLLSRTMPLDKAFPLDSESALNLAKDAAVDYQPVNLDGLIAISAGRITPDWISAFDEIGQMLRVIVWGPSSLRNKFASNMRDAFVGNTGQRGLARILGRLVRSPIDEIDRGAMQIPLAVLNKLNWTDYPYRENLILLRLANTDLSPEATVDLAQEIARTPEVYENFVADCLRVARSRLSADAQERFVLELWRDLLPSAWESRSVTIEVVHDLLRQRRSAMADPAVRRKLKLPTFDT